MSHDSPLFNSLQLAITSRIQKDLTVYCLDQPLPSHAPDFFSNDYLSLSADDSVRDIFLRRAQAASPGRLFGSSGSRLLTGNSTEFNALEKAFQSFFQAPSALLFGSGFSANVAFLGAVPQKNDVIIYDELIHASCRDGIRSSPRASYRFSHNSVASFKECLLRVLQNHPEVIQGNSTVFVVIESLYSMDGDFCPLTEIVEVVESSVPAGRAHIVVDEAHTSGIYGPNGTGYVAHLGLNDRVHTKVHTFGKAWGYHGAVVLTSSIIRNYLINFATCVEFSTSMPFTDLYALESCLCVMSGARGQKLRNSLHRMSRYARQKFVIALRNIPAAILTLDKSDATNEVPDHALYSPIIPVFTPRVEKLADHLLQKGYAVTPITYPFVKQPRIRVIIHARNTEEEIDAFINELLTWAEGQMCESASTGGANGSTGGGGVVRGCESETLEGCV